MTLTFIEIKNFMEYREDYFASDDAFSALQQALCTNWPDERRGKGKRGGLRIIYLLVPEIEAAVFIDVYDKDETENFTSEERQVLSELAKTSRDELIALSVQQRKRL